MNNDLISREALRKAIEEQRKSKVYSEADERQNVIIDCILYIIDNAQPVEPEITNDDLQAAMTESYHLGYELAETKFKRPHGKWIEEPVPIGLVGRGNGQYRCSNCQHGDIQAKTQEVPYCWYCGAKMDKKEADNEQ